MRAEVILPIGALYGFLLVLARVAGVFVFVPLPGVRNGPEMVRVMLALGIALSLAPQWPRLAAAPGAGQLAGWLILEAALGLALGLAVQFFTESFVMAAQVVGLQAGYSYASMIDPQTQADSGVLLVFAQLAAGLLFFALGLDGQVLRAIAQSLEMNPPGAWTPPAAAGEAVVRLGAGMFAAGMRLAMPAVALLVLVDIALALLGRLHAQLQLLTISFPVKMLAALAVLAWTSVLLPEVARGYWRQALAMVRALLGLAGG